MIEVAILGVGLIGGSLALSLKKHEDIHITGFDVNENNLHMAVSLGVIDQGTSHLAEAVSNADYIFLGAPVETLHELISFLRYTPLKKGAVICDTGSTKKTVLKMAQGLEKKGIFFIGGHPMAGSHQSGVEASNDRLFENAYFVLTPSEETPEDVLDRLKALLVPTRAKVIVMDSYMHDQIVGAISHFPHIIASTLVNLVAGYNGETDWYRQLAAGGFRDITRIASSNPRMWRDILLNNRPVLLDLYKDWKETLDDLMERIEKADGEAIEEFLAQGRAFRDCIPEKQRGAIRPYYDLYVDIPDTPGIIGKVTTLLGQHEISITNIRILETREDVPGVLRISFHLLDEIDHAAEILVNAGYKVYQRE